MVKSNMEQNERYDAAVEPVDSEGGRIPSALSTGQADPASGVARIGPLAPGQRWSVGRKREIVLRLMRGESTELLSRELGLCPASDLRQRIGHSQSAEFGGQSTHDVAVHRVRRR